MPIKVTCANCGGVLHAPDDAGGKRGRCPTCGNILPIPADAPKASGTALPDPTAAPKGGRQQSFGEFALGPQVGPPPGAADNAPIPFKDKDDKPAVAGAKKSSTQDTSRPTDPFARSGAKAAVGEKPGTGDKAWKKARSGLGWTRLGVLVLAIPVLGLSGLAIAEYFTKKPLIPENSLPFAEGSLRELLPLLLSIASMLLGLILMSIGRLGFSSLPKRAYARGLAFLAALATLIALAGLVLFCYSHVALMILGEKPNFLLFDLASSEGKLQHYGLLGGLGAWIAAEFWFASAVGRVGAALDDSRTAARSTRYLLILGVVLAAFIGTASLMPTTFGFGKTIGEVARDSHKELVSNVWVPTVQPLFGKLGEYETLLIPGLTFLAGLMVIVLNLRMIGAARAAIRGKIGS